MTDKKFLADFHAAGIVGFYLLDNGKAICDEHAFQREILRARTAGWRMAKEMGKRIRDEFEKIPGNAEA